MAFTTTPTTTNPMFAPENLLKMSAAMFSAPTFAQGLGGATDALSTSMTAAKEKQKLDEIKNLTVQKLETEAPDLAEAVKIGTISASDGYRTYLNRKAEAAKAARPDYQFMDVNGKIVRVDKNDGSFNQVADYSQPKLPPIAEEYEWAKNNGFTGTPQEYQVWKANLSKQKGLEVTYDQENGFRMTQGDVDPGKMPKLTEAEGKNAGFYLRAKESNDLLTAVEPANPGQDAVPSLENEGTSERNRIADNVPVVGNYLRSSQGQKYQQAKDNFITAVLRKESGAVIGETEYAREDRKYFPQPNDGPEVIEQKRRAREAAIQGLKIGAGPASEKIDAGNDDPMGLR